MDDMKVRPHIFFPLVSSLNLHVAISPFFTLFALFAIITKQQLLSLPLKLIFKNIDFVLLLICFSHPEGNCIGLNIQKAELPWPSQHSLYLILALMGVIILVFPVV